MMQADGDLRTVKTKEAIYGAFLSLIERCSFSEIRVKSLCDEARINRSTFYDYFEDKYDLLRKLLQDLSADTARDFVYFTAETPAAGPMLAPSRSFV